MANTRTGAARTAAAVAANRRRKQDRMAAELREAGWFVAAPEQVPALELLERPAAASTRRIEFVAAHCAGQLQLT